MLEFLAAVDPVSLPIWAILAWSAAMYPIGIMLGAPCSACCSPPCSSCETGELPDTITVTFSGFPDTFSVQGPDLIQLSCSACYGSRASGKATAPGGDPATAAGPIASVALTNGGSGYAKLGRVEPTVTASGSGSGALLSVSLTKHQDACNVDYWQVSTVTVDNGGTGYVDGTPVTFAVAEGDTAETAASATIHTTTDAPTLTATAIGGTGASLSLTTTQIGTSNRWQVSTVTVDNGGTGYTDGSSVTIGLGSGDVEETPAFVVINTVRGEPTLTASVSSTSGTGASVSPTLTETTDGGGRPIWSVSAITVVNGGSGYAVGDYVTITVTDGTESPFSYFWASVSSVDGSGSITAITLSYGGAYFKATGVIESVDIISGGSYYNDDGVISSVTVESGGVYYREDATEPPYVAAVTVNISQAAPSAGSGATITATVGDDPSNPETFGTITGLTIEDGGDGYLAWEAIVKKHCCGDINGKPIALRRNPQTDIGPPYADHPCTYLADTCEFPTDIGYVKVVYLGPTTPPKLAFYSQLCALARALNDDMSSDQSGQFVTEELISDCSDFSFTAHGTFRGTSVTATVEPGGDYQSTPIPLDDCFVCCKGAGGIASEVTASFTGQFVSDYDGDYVLTRYVTLGGWGAASDNQLRRWYASFPAIDGAPAWPLFPVGFTLSLEPCSARQVGSYGPISSFARYGSYYYYGKRVIDADTCNRCHRACMTYAYPAGVLGLALDEMFYEYPISIEDETCDSACKSTPICAPSAGDYVIPAFGTVSVS